MTPRILLFEPSFRYSRSLKAALQHEGRSQVIGETRDPLQALALAEETRPDAMVLSVERGIDLAGLCRSVMQAFPLPLILLTPEGEDRRAEVEEALANGAVGALVKPDPAADIAGRDWRRLVRDILGLAEVKLVRVRQQRAAAGKGAEPPLPSDRTPADRQYRLLAIGCSTGGPQALQAVLSRLPADFPLPVLVVQHMSAGFVDNLVQWLDSVTPLTVRLATSGETLRPGTVLIAPDDQHLVVMTAGERLMAGLTSAPPVGGFRPAANALFASAAAAAGDKAVGLLLTGMGSDGAEGLLAMRRGGALTIAQDEESSVVYGMNGAAVEMGAAQVVVPLERIPTLLNRLAGPAEPAETPPAAAPKAPAKRVLVVDDSRTFRLLISGVLTKLGCEVVGEAEDGLQAIEMYRQLTPDLVLLDIAMPRLDGLAALRAIKKAGLGGAVIMCTTVDNVDLMDDCLLAGAEDYVQKDKLEDVSLRLRPYLA